ncbi:MAG: histidine--tRNA ligase [Christensenellaceae bacterium]|nr:histidine--tRNA ligase [Christensenellaceae bacterium]
MIEKPKGTKSMLPQDSFRWQFIADNIRKLMTLYCASEIRTPTFEYTELFLRGVGDSTDIVNKEMYTFLDKGGRSITLKPEGTAGVVREFVESGMFNDPQPTKLYYIMPSFRYENPQAGRLREFHQFGVEYFGASSPKADFEGISVAIDFLKALKFRDFKLHLNSIGCPECRKKYNEVLTNFLGSKLKVMCPDCNRRFKTNPLRILDCKNEDCKKILKCVPKVTDFLCDECKIHFTQVQKLLKDAKIDFIVDGDLVRGLDYYTKTVFEIMTDIKGVGTITLVGGGRYDNLVESLDGPKTPAFGFGCGIERLLFALEKSEIEICEPQKTLVYITKATELNTNLDIEIAVKLREKGISCEVDLCDRSFKAQFKYANKLGVKYNIIIGEKELAGGKITLKDMTSGQEQQVEADKVADLIK